MATQVSGRDPKVAEHRRISRQFLRQAQAEFENGDRLQASGKAWDAATHAVKAVAQHRGWRHEDERDLFEAITEIYRETGNSEFLRLFQLACSLYMNSFEDWQPDGFVQDGIEKVAELLEKLEPLVE